MAEWLRITLLVAVGLWSLGARPRIKHRVLNLLVTFGGGSGWRAFGVVLLYYLAIALILVAFEVLGGLGRQQDLEVLAVLVTLAGFATVGPFLLVIEPLGYGGQEASSIPDLRRHGATKAGAGTIVRLPIILIPAVFYLLILGPGTTVVGTPVAAPRIGCLIL